MKNSRRLGFILLRSVDVGLISSKHKLSTYVLLGFGLTILFCVVIILFYDWLYLAREIIEYGTDMLMYV